MHGTLLGKIIGARREVLLLTMATVLFVNMIALLLVFGILRKVTIEVKFLPLIYYGFIKFMTCDNDGVSFCGFFTIFMLSSLPGVPQSFSNQVICKGFKNMPNLFILETERTSRIFFSVDKLFSV